MAAEVVSLLGNLRSADNAIRDAAEKSYAEAQKASPEQTLAGLVGCLDPGACPDEVVRTQAATLLRRAAVQTGPAETTFARCSPSAQTQIRQALFQKLEAEPSHGVRKMLVAGISTMACQIEGPWPELIPNTFALAASSSPSHQDAALRLLGELVNSPHAQDIMSKRQEVGSLVSAGLSAPALRAAALGFVGELISNLDDDGSVEAMQPVLPLVEEALKGLAATDASAFEEALTSLISSAEEKTVFFRPRFAEWVAMMLTFADAKGSIDDGARALALEWVSTVLESKAKALVKAVPDLPQRVLKTSLAFIAEVEEDDLWKGVDEDEEEDDDDSLVKAGEAKVDAFMKKLGFEQAGKPLMSLLEQCIASQRWEGKFAAAMAIRAAGEYVTVASALDTMAGLLLQLLQDEHYRVRYAAAFALGQMCHDQEKEFHARWHARLVPPLLKACSDPVERVAAMSASAVEAVISELDEEVLEVYAQQFLQVFVACLNSCSHKGVLVAIMQALGALAAGLEGGFAGYYDQLMEMLLAFVAKPGADATAMKLRGKAFECISLLGFSVGKEKFAPAASRAMEAMLATPAASDGAQTECIREAMQRICEVLGADFARFLPALLPGILASVSLDSAVSVTGNEDDAEDDEIVIPTDGGFLKIKSGQAMEVLEIVGLLNTFVKETGEAFFDFVPPTVEALAKILDCSNSVLNIASMVRDSVYPCWADLVGAISKAVPAKGEQAQQLVVALVQRFVDKVGAALVGAEDPEDIAPMSNGIASVVKNAGIGCLQPAQVQGICDLALSEILKSFQRDEALKAANAQAGGAAAAAAALRALQEEDADDAATDVEEMEEAEARIGLTAIFGACAKASPDVFMSHALPKLQPLMQQWLGPKEGHPARLLGLHIACDCCEYLGSRAVPLWPLFMDAALAALASKEADERQAAAFTLLLASQESVFGAQFASRAYVALAASLQKFKPKKSDEDAQRAADNVVAALVELCLRHPTLCPDPDGCWSAAFARMPLKVDTEEGHKMHRKLFTEAQKPGGGSLGSMARVAQVLGYLCEIHGKSEFCDDDLERDLATALASLPQSALESLVPNFSQKQQKRVERILASARAQT